MKKKVVGLIIIILIIFISWFVLSDNGEVSNKTNVNEVLEVVNLFEKMKITEYVIDDYLLSSVNLSLNDGNDGVEVNLISNIESSNIVLELLLYDKDNNLLETVSFTIDSLFEGEERTLLCYVDFDLNKVESFSAKIKND